MNDFTLRTYGPDDAVEGSDDMVATVSSDWAIVVGDQVVGRLQADEGAAMIGVKAAPDLAKRVADRFLAHHLLEAQTVTIRTNGAESTFTRA